MTNHNFGKQLLRQSISVLLISFILVLGAFADARAGKPGGTDLQPPASLAATTSEKRIDLAWQYSDSGISGFSIERSQSAATGFAVIATVDSAALSFCDEGLADSTTYHYRARAFKQKGKNISYSEYSSEASATTASSVMEPAPVLAPGALEFAVSSYSVNEGAGQVDITINRIGGNDGIVTVDWRTKGVTATYGEDYGDFGWTTLTFADGETSKTKTVTITNDTLVEGDETFDVLLGNPTGGATLGNITTSAVTIIDDDSAIVVANPGAFEFSASSYSVDESAGQVDITIKRVGGSDGVATVDWKTQGVTATYGEDYGNFGWTTLTFADGETGKVKSIAIVHDSIVENDEIFDVLLGNPTGGATLGAISSAAVTIVDDDTDVGGSEPVAEEPTAPSVSYLPVFPGAQGFGTETKAGRGGKIVKVTNLNDSGTGSLRAALTASGPRIVVFEVSGTISLSSKIEITNPYVTIAGQTAPSPGILIKGDDIIVCTHDVLIQHIRSRHGSGSTGDAIAIGQYNNSNVYNVVLDHVSASWATDENGNTWFEPHDITISNSIFSEGLNESGHGMGLLVGDSTKRVAVIGNLFAHNYQRNPLVKGGASAVVLNNVMYDGGILWMYFDDPRGSGPIYASTVGNVFIDGPSTSSSKYIQVKGTVQSGTEIYLSDNKAIGSGTLFTKGTSFDPRVSTPPVWHPSLLVRNSDVVESWVLSNAGARPADRDPVDERLVTEVKNRSGSIINDQSEVGGFPSLAKNVRTFPVPSDPSGDDDGDGYTNIEEVLHQMASQVEGK